MVHLLLPISITMIGDWTTQGRHLDLNIICKMPSSYKELCVRLLIKWIESAAGTQSPLQADRVHRHGTLCKSRSRRYHASSSNLALLLCGATCLRHNALTCSRS